MKHEDEPRPNDEAVKPTAMDEAIERFRYAMERYYALGEPDGYWEQVLPTTVYDLAFPFEGSPARGRPS